MYHKMLPLKVPWYVLRVNKAEHAVQSYAAGIGARKPGGPIQCEGRATLPIGVNDGERGKQDDKRGKGGNKTTEKFLAKPVPRAAVAYGRQLKIVYPVFSITNIFTKQGSRYSRDPRRPKYF